MSDDYVMEEEGEEDAAEREARESVEWRAEEGEEGSGGVLALLVAAVSRNYSACNPVVGAEVVNHYY